MLLRQSDSKFSGSRFLQFGQSNWHDDDAVIATGDINFSVVVITVFCEEFSLIVSRSLRTFELKIIVSPLDELQS